MATPNPDASKAAAPQSPGPQPGARMPEPPATSATTLDVPNFGWSGYAERINGRFAMVGFVAILVIEALSGETFLHWAGLVP